MPRSRRPSVRPQRTKVSLRAAAFTCLMCTWELTHAELRESARAPVDSPHSSVWLCGIWFAGEVLLSRATHKGQTGVQHLFRLRYFGLTID